MSGNNNVTTSPRHHVTGSIWKMFFLFFLLLVTWCHGDLVTCYAADIKEPNVAGAFYPGDAKQLQAMIDGFLKIANPSPMPGQVFALISPHAGYGYSGPTAAFGYKLIAGKPYKTVIVIAPTHRYGFAGVSVYPDGIFRTPLGDIPVDSDFTQKLLNKDPDVSFDSQAFAQEHSLEVQLPFLQKTLTGFKLVPIIMGDCTLDTCQRLAELLKNAIGSRKDVLVVVSTDMYHGYDYQETEKIDKSTISYLEKMDAQGLYYALRDEKVQLCGGFGVVTTLILSRSLGHEKLKVLHYTDSSKVTNNRKNGVWTVGYVSCAIDKPEKGEKGMLNREQRKKLLELARNSIETYLKTGKKLQIKETDPLFLKEMGAFVTLHEHSELRGCIGNIVGKGPLYLTIRDMAVEAATGDPRFSPVEPEELKNIEIEISVLTPLERVDSPDKIQMGVHGVLVRRGFNSGVFLPQVATETGWSREEFLSNLCSHKAGLDSDAWKDKSTELYIFSAEVFSEKDY